MSRRVVFVPRPVCHKPIPDLAANLFVHKVIKYFEKASVSFQKKKSRQRIHSTVYMIELATLFDSGA